MRFRGFYSDQRPDRDQVWRHRDFGGVSFVNEVTLRPPTINKLVWYGETWFTLLASGGFVGHVPINIS